MEGGATRESRYSSGINVQFAKLLPSQETKPRAARLRQPKGEKLTASWSPFTATGSPVPAPGIMGELRDIPATHLDKYIEDQLLPDTHFRVQVNQAIDIMSSFLKERCFQRAAHSVRVLKVVKVSPGLPAWGRGGWAGRLPRRQTEDNR